MPQFYKSASQQMFHAGKIALVLVGLPATGKTYISHKLSHYLRWVGVRAASFTLAMYREKMFGRQPHNFFDPENKDALERRKILVEHALADMMEFLNEGQVAIFDGTNVTRAQRKNILDRLTPKKIQVIFIEVVNTDPSIAQEIFIEEMQTSPNYAGFVPSEASADLKARIEHYTKINQPISEKEDQDLSYIKLINIAEELVVHNIKGYLQTRMVFFLMNVHIGFRNIFLCRDNCGEDGKSFMEGGRKPLSQKGNEFAAKLRDLILEQIRTPDGLNFGEANQPLTVWTSTNTRSKDIGSYFAAHGNVVEISALTDMNPGLLDNMTPEEIEEKYPQEFAEFQADVYNYRFPRAESYRDLSVRMEPIIAEVERGKGHILVIAQKQVLQCLYSYFTDMPEESIPFVDLPEYSVTQLRPRAYTCLNKFHKISMST